MCIVTIYFPVDGVMNFKINRIFLIKPFSYVTKKLGQTFEYLKNEKSFWVGRKSIFHDF